VFGHIVCIFLTGISFEPFRENKEKNESQSIHHKSTGIGAGSCAVGEHEQPAEH
jgi:hypothetical protein